jgi:phi13 family phage major tail protein
MSYVAAAQLGDMSIAVQSADIPPDVRAEWYGQEYSEGLLIEGQINPIEMAFGYRIKKANGAYRYIWHYKVKPTPPDETTQTQGNSINFQDGSVNMQATMRLSDGTHRKVVDDDDPNLPEGINVETIAQNFFTDLDWAPVIIG